MLTIRVDILKEKPKKKMEVSTLEYDLRIIVR